VIVAGFSLITGGSIFTTVNEVVFKSPLFFFAFVMLTEPLTTPPNYVLQFIYGALVGFLYAPQFHLGGIYSTPELALLVGNIFSYVVSPKEKLILKLKEKIRITPDTYDFIFPLEKKLSFVAGQYMEWTLAHHNPDSRGNRRYFTLASSPTERNVRIGVKFYPQSSSFKRAMLNETTDIVAASQAGDFTLIPDINEKLVFIAGGIGITPYRSMLKYLIDKNEQRDIVVLYSNKYKSEIVYKDIFDEAQEKLNIKIIYTLTDKRSIAHNLNGETGRIDELMIQKNVPDYKERFFYLSGPHAMVTSFEEVLNKMGVKENRIKKDFFPGFV